MVEVKVHRLMFRYPADMPEGDKRNITIKSGYRASASLRDGHKVVYRNLIKKYTLDGVKNTTRSAMGELNRRFPDRYQELRLEFQKSMVQAWRAELRGDQESAADKSRREYVPVSPYCDPLERPKVEKGFFARLFRRG